MYFGQRARYFQRHLISTIRRTESSVYECLAIIVCPFAFSSLTHYIFDPIRYEIKITTSTVYRSLPLEEFSSKLVIFSTSNFQQKIVLCMLHMLDTILN